MNSSDYVKKKMYSEQKGPGFKRLFSPLYLLSQLYGLAVKLRYLLYKKGILQERAIDSYVISVGNIVVGGTGKTPTVIYVAKLLQSNGYKVCVLSRGYKGKNTSKYLEVSNEKEVLTDHITAGDEPYLLAHKLKGIPVVVGKNRYIAGQYAVEKFRPDVCIMDDGFSHIKLKRDLEIVTFDGNSGFGNGSLLPDGILREPVTALDRADIVLINKGVKKSKEIIARVSGLKCKDKLFFCSYDTVALNSWMGGVKSTNYISGKKILLFSALANSNYFYEIISRLGGSICDQLEFQDHHDYSIDDYFKIVKAAYDSSADLIITTEKDIVKFDREWGKNSNINIFSLDIMLKPLAYNEITEKNRVWQRIKKTSI